MSKTIEFYFDVGSPASYLAWSQLPAIAQRTGATLVYKPMLLGGVFMATGNSSPATVPAKGAYSRIDMQRFANRYGVTLNQNPFFPINTLQLMRAVTAYQGTPQFEPLLTAIFNAMWISAWTGSKQPRAVDPTDRRHPLRCRWSAAVKTCFAAN